MFDSKKYKEKNEKKNDFLTINYSKKIKYN